MPIRRTLASFLIRPAVEALDASLRDLIDEILDGRGLVRQPEVAALQARIDDFRRELTDRRADLAALRQSMEALALADDDAMDDDLAELGLGASSADLDSLRASQDELSARIDLGTNTVTALRAQLDRLQQRAEAAAERAEKALATASSALATAEAAADGVSGLEDRLASGGA
jgi:chromosome segregation ATPase